MLINPELTAWARRHHGLVTLDAWRAAGHSRSSFYRALDAELLTSLLPGVAALAGRPIGPVERIAAGVLAFGPGVVASHRSAAYLWDAPVTGDRPVDLTSTGRRGGTTIDGYLVHRPRDLDALRTPLRRQIPTTAPARVLFDLGVVVDRRVVLRTFESFLVAGHVTVRAVEAELARGRRPGRTGTTALAWALTQVHDGLAVPDSALESQTARVFRRAGLERWVFHAVVEGHEVDFAFPAERLVVEVDGWRYHGADREQWERDRDRDLHLASLGWTVVRLTWRMITHQPALAARRLQAALDHRSGRPASHRQDGSHPEPTTASAERPVQKRSAKATGSATSSWS